MAQKAKVNGETRTITAGRCKVGGESHNIKWGRTLINSKLYMIPLTNPTLRELFDDAELKQIAGRNDSTTAQVAINSSSMLDGLYYIFSFCRGYMSVYKVTRTNGNLSALTALKQMSASYGNAVVNANKIIYAPTGEGSSTTWVAYAATLAALQFPHFSESVTDGLLSGMTLTRCGGADSSGTTYVYTAGSNLSGGLSLVAMGTNIGVNYHSSASTCTNILGNQSYNRSLLLYQSSNARFYISTNGTDYASIYGGSIVSAT